jgi:short subunit dehydrogenase-like uncharacterized protein
MSTDKPVIVYGASGYTGRLICEYLREYHVPFIAAGRDKARIQDALDHVPGIDTVDHEVIEVAHEVGPLTDLFAGARSSRPAWPPDATTWTRRGNRTG